MSCKIFRRNEMFFEEPESSRDMFRAERPAGPLRIPSLKLIDRREERLFSTEEARRADTENHGLLVCGTEFLGSSPLLHSLESG